MYVFKKEHNSFKELKKIFKNAKNQKKQQKYNPQTNSIKSYQ